MASSAETEKSIGGGSSVLVKCMCLAMKQALTHHRAVRNGRVMHLREPMTEVKCQRCKRGNKSVHEQDENDERCVYRGFRPGTKRIDNSLKPQKWDLGAVINIIRVETTELEWQERPAC
jgi:hypothetical protein